jgi:hypothetical protein
VPVLMLAAGNDFKTAAWPSCRCRSPNRCCWSPDRCRRSPSCRCRSPNRCCRNPTRCCRRQPRLGSPSGTVRKCYQGRSQIRPGPRSRDQASRTFALCNQPACARYSIWSCQCSMPEVADKVLGSATLIPSMKLACLGVVREPYRTSAHDAGLWWPIRLEGHGSAPAREEARACAAGKLLITLKAA